MSRLAASRGQRTTRMRVRVHVDLLVDQRCPTLDAVGAADRCCAHLQMCHGRGMNRREILESAVCAGVPTGEGPDSAPSNQEAAQMPAKACEGGESWCEAGAAHAAGAWNPGRRYLQRRPRGGELGWLFEGPGRPDRIHQRAEAGSLLQARRLPTAAAAGRADRDPPRAARAVATGDPTPRSHRLSGRVARLAGALRLKGSEPPSGPRGGLGRDFWPPRLPKCVRHQPLRCRHWQVRSNGQRTRRASAAPAVAPRLFEMRSAAVGWRRRLSLG